MTINPHQVLAADVYRHLTACITPRPIGWVSTISPAGIANLAPFSFFNGVGANPPAVIFSPVNRRDGSRKDTILNIEANGEFVVNIVSGSLAELMNATSADFDYGVSEFEPCGLTAVPSLTVRPPRVKESAVHLECTLHQIVYVGDGPLSANVVIGRVVMMHLDDRILGPGGQVDPEKLDTIGRMGGSLYARTRDRFAMERPSRPQ